MISLLALAGAAAAVTTSDFFPYGSAAGDGSIDEGDGGCGPNLSMSANPIVYGESASRNLQFSRDGTIGFNACEGSETGRDLPALAQGGLAIWWGDHDYRGTGIENTLYYRSDSSQATEFQSRLNDLGFGNSFIPSSVVIVTWEDVGYHDAATDETVTYQAALGTDGTDTYLITYYASMGWTESNGVTAVVGFESPSGSNSFQYPEATVLNIENESNVGVAGTFVYKISDPSFAVVFGDPVIVDFAGHKFAAGRQPSTWSSLLETESGEAIRMRTSAVKGVHDDYFIDTVEFVRPACGSMTVKVVAGMYEAEVSAPDCFASTYLEGDSGLVVYSMQTEGALVAVQTHASPKKTFSFLNVQLVEAPVALRKACVGGLLCNEAHREDLTL